MAVKTATAVKKVRELSEEDVLKAPDKDYMNEAQLAFFKRKLIELRDQLLQNADDTGEHLRENEVTTDPSDRATREEEYALELRTRDRERKLLLSRREIDRMSGRAQAKGFTVVPLAMYLKGDRVKVEIALVQGKKLFDKRETGPRRDAQSQALSDAADLKRRFLGGHLGRWAAPFCEAVRGGAQCAFYRELADLTDRFIATEARRAVAG